MKLRWLALAICLAVAAVATFLFTPTPPPAAHAQQPTTTTIPVADCTLDDRNVDPFDALMVPVLDNPAACVWVIQCFTAKDGTYVRRVIEGEPPAPVDGEPPPGPPDPLSICPTAVEWEALSLVPVHTPPAEPSTNPYEERARQWQQEQEDFRAQQQEYDNFLDQIDAIDKAGGSGTVTINGVEYEYEEYEPDPFAP